MHLRDLKLNLRHHPLPPPRIAQAYAALPSVRGVMLIALMIAPRLLVRASTAPRARQLSAPNSDPMGGLQALFPNAGKEALFLFIHPCFSRNFAAKPEGADTGLIAGRVACFGSDPPRGGAAGGADQG